MPILPNPSVSPLHSFVNRPGLPRPVNFVEALNAVVAWWRGQAAQLAPKYT
jgi:hypothetical protein